MEIVVRYREIQNDYDLWFADTEFSRLPLPAESMADWTHRVTLISVGLTALNSSSSPAEFYRYRSLNKKVLKACDAFVLSEVIPHLKVVESGVPFSDLTQLKRMLIEFTSARRRSTGKVPLICVDWSGDAMLLDPLLGRQKYLLLDDLSEVNEAMHSFFTGGYVRHNALHDASAIKHGFINHLTNASLRDAG